MKRDVFNERYEFCILNRERKYELPILNIHAAVPLANMQIRRKNKHKIVCRISPRNRMHESLVIISHSRVFFFSLPCIEIQIPSNSIYCSEKIHKLDGSKYIEKGGVGFFGFRHRSAKPLKITKLRSEREIAEYVE